MVGTRYSPVVQLRLPLRPPGPSSGRAPGRAPATSALTIDAHTYAVVIARHRRARRFVLRMTTEGVLRLTVPRGAAIDDGLAFARRQGAWIAGERVRQSRRSVPWGAGAALWFRGERVRVDVDAGVITFGQDAIQTGGSGVRAAIEAHLRAIALRELPARCLALCAAHGLTVTRVTIRNQRARWGSCSASGRIALNWRLVQMPAEVSDYVILHELMHLKQANHSRRFWREVEAVCVGWRDAERWLKRHGPEIL